MQTSPSLHYQQRISNETSFTNQVMDFIFYRIYKKIKGNDKGAEKRKNKNKNKTKTHPTARHTLSQFDSTIVQLSHCQTKRCIQCYDVCQQINKRLHFSKQGANSSIIPSVCVCACVRVSACVCVSEKSSRCWPPAKPWNIKNICVIPHMGVFTYF